MTLESPKPIKSTSSKIINGVREQSRPDSPEYDDRRVASRRWATNRENEYIHVEFPKTFESKSPCHCVEFRPESVAPLRTCAVSAKRQQESHSKEALEDNHALPLFAHSPEFVSDVRRRGCRVATALIKQVNRNNRLTRKQPNATEQYTTN